VGVGIRRLIQKKKQRDRKKEWGLTSAETDTGDGEKVGRCFLKNETQWGVTERGARSNQVKEGGASRDVKAFADKTNQVMKTKSGRLNVREKGASKNQGNVPGGQAARKGKKGERKINGGDGTGGVTCQRNRKKEE